MKAKLLGVAAMAAAAALGLSACGGSEASGGDTQEVTLMLNWYPYGEHAGLYYGLEEGIFEDHGIELNIEPGQGSTKTAQAVGAGEVAFGWADTPAVLGNIDNGVPIQSVGVFLQTTPSAVQVFADSGIEEPADLAGKTIAVSTGDAPTTTFPMYLDAVGLSEDDVTQQNMDPAGKISAMLTGQVDGLIGFAHDQGPTIAAESGRDVKYFRYADAGLNFYGTGLVVSNKTIEDNPELVDEMVAATSESFAAAMENPEEAVAAMAGKSPQMPEEDVLTDQWKETIELLHTDATEGDSPGFNSSEDWKSTLEVLSEAGLIKDNTSIEDYYDDSFAPAGE